MIPLVLVAQLTVTIAGGQATSNAPKPTPEQAVAVLRTSHSPYDLTNWHPLPDGPRWFFTFGRPTDGPFGSFPRGYPPIAPLSHHAPEVFINGYGPVSPQGLETF